MMPRPLLAKSCPRKITGQNRIALAEVVLCWQKKGRIILFKYPTLEVEEIGIVHVRLLILISQGLGVVYINPNVFLQIDSKMFFFF